ncbi:MAG: efflux RND transporter permease subunit [Calditrichaeota bacterium]|nr:efflux RND transporter permease subunit [Calditrichota bacterium]
MIKIFINRPIAVLMFFLAVFVTGMMSLRRLPLELTPEVSYPKLSVATQWPNSSAEMVEAYVTAPIEAVANTIANVRKVDSISDEGNSTVNIELTREANPDFAALELNEKLSVIRESLPFGTSPPKIQKYVPKEFQSGEFLTYHLFGNYTPLEVRQYALKNMRGPLMGIKGVADVQVYGGQDEEIHIILDRGKLKLFGLTVEQIQRTIREMAVEETVGRLYRGAYKFELVVRNPLTSVEEIARAQILMPKNLFVHISDVAKVERSVQDVRQIGRINGNPAVIIQIFREPGTNVIQVADRVFAKIAELKKKFPPSLELIKERDQSKRIRKELRDLSVRALFSVIVIFFVLLIFLRRFRMPLIILSTIFFSVLLTINFFYAAHIGLNLLTLAGLSLGFGMLVDNAIVVLDSIHRHWQKGIPVAEACAAGTSAVALAIVAATLTTVAAFIPFLYLTGELRLYYIPFVAAVGLSLMSSLLVAFTLIPSLSHQLLIREFTLTADFERSGLLDQKLRNFYEKTLRWILRHKIIVLLVTIFCFWGSYKLFDKHVTKGSIWAWGEETYIAIWARMPSGADIETTDQLARFFEEKLKQQQGVEKFYTRVTNETAYIRVTFPDSLIFSAVPLIVKENMTAAATQLAGMVVGVYGFGPGFYSGGGGSTPSFRLKMLGYNYNQVKKYAEFVGQRLKRNVRVRNVDVSSSGFGWGDDRREILLSLNRGNVAKYHLTNVEVLNQLRNYLRENLAWQKLKINGREFAYKIKFKGFQHFTLRDLQNVPIRSASGESVRLKHLAEISERKVMSRIVREDQQYQRWITFEYRGPYKLGDRLIESILKTSHFPPGYELERATWMFMKKEEKKQIYQVLALSILLVFMVTAALFESLRQPFIVILTIPLALIGIFLIFYLTATNFDRSAYIGVVFLSGIVVNNAIILVDHINAVRKLEKDRRTAIITGAADRVRPILMTTATTVFGLLPLVLFSHEEKSIWFSLALATIGGLIASAVFVLTVIPILYDWLAKNLDLRRGLS